MQESAGVIPKLPRSRSSRMIEERVGLMVAEPWLRICGQASVS
jgi:hypothetical protein